MGLGDDVKQVAGQVASDLGGVVKDTAKVAAKTPLDILEEILGGDPGAKAGDGSSTSADAMKDLEQGKAGAQDDAGQNDAAQKAAIQQQMQQDQTATQQKLQMHRTNMAGEQQFYEQQKTEVAQMKQVEEQEKKQKEQFEIQQLKHERKENLQVATAKMANDAERSRNMGSG